MIFHPGIIALLAESLLMGIMLFYSTYHGLLILLRWDLKSGSELQLNLERRTYLVSTVMNYAFGFQIISLFLFIYTADSLHSLFVGAMCAAGSLNVNGFGYPTIVLKTINTVLAGLWLVVNYTDNKAFDYPLIRLKYGLLLFVTPLIIFEMLIQSIYLLKLKPNIITSCCGTLFSSGSAGTLSALSDLPVALTEVLFYSITCVTIFSGIYFRFKGKGVYLFALMTIATFLISIAGIISFASPYFYELPTHHCPFCILQSEYHYIGYPLYITLLLGVTTGLGAGVIAPFRKIRTLAAIVPVLQRRFAIISVVSICLFLLIVLYGVAFSNLHE